MGDYDPNMPMNFDGEGMAMGSADDYYYDPNMPTMNYDGEGMAMGSGDEYYYYDPTMMTGEGSGFSDEHANMDADMAFNHDGDYYMDANMPATGDYDGEGYYYDDATMPPMNHDDHHMHAAHHFEHGHGN